MVIILDLEIVFELFIVWLEVRLPIQCDLGFVDKHVHVSADFAASPESESDLRTHFYSELLLQELLIKNWEYLVTLVVLDCAVVIEMGNEIR